LLTYEEAEKSCSLAENGSYLITIHSKEEQDFVSNFLFGTNGLVENIWLGLKNKNNNFKWVDGSTLEFANWANESPSKEPNHDCVQMVADSHPKGKWVDEPCMICPTIIIFSYDFYRAISFGLISLLLILLYCYYSAALIHYCLMYFLVICHY
jgi:hypothetical protein